MKTLALNEFISLNINLDAWDQNILNKSIELSKEVSKFIPASVYVICHEDEKEENLFFDYSEVKIDNTNIHISKRENDKNYRFFSDLKFSNLNYYDIRNISENLTEPKKVAVLNLKKINDWIEYLNKIDNLCKEESQKRSNDVETFLKSLEGQNVRWFGDNKTAGEIKRNGLIFSFTINNGYVSKKIEFDYFIDSNLENFLALSDNKFISKKA